MKRSDAQNLDQNDPLAKWRENFHLPLSKQGHESLYFCGHSLGAQPKKTQIYVQEELDNWAQNGVNGHFSGPRPWMHYLDHIVPTMSQLVGARNHEVSIMNSLTANLHFLLISFYRPTKSRFKIIMEADAFPSDHYAIDSQVRFHGLDPEKTVIKIKPDEGERLLSVEKILQTIDQQGDQLALVLLGNVNYLTGQYYPIDQITRSAHKVGAYCGYDLAHAAGNIELELHCDQVDFACWCNYKYLNGGPGTIASLFVHEKHHQDVNIPRLEGWWGNEKASRFKMSPFFKPSQGADAWQLSNPPILQLAALRASMEIFQEVTREKIFAKGRSMTAYLEELLDHFCGKYVEIITPRNPKERGLALSLRLIQKGSQQIQKGLEERGIIGDFREPDVLRIAPAPLYNRFTELFDVVDALRELHG